MPKINFRYEMFKTEPNTAFFWSGKTEGAGGAETAAGIARLNGGTTLEMLMEKHKDELISGGFEYDDYKKCFVWNPDDDDNVKAWNDISAAYAEQVSGEVSGVIGNELRPGNVWEGSELPALERNPNVTGITIIDPKTGKTKEAVKAAGRPDAKAGSGGSVPASEDNAGGADVIPRDDKNVLLTGPAPAAPLSGAAASDASGGANVIPRDKIKVDSPYPIYEYHDIKITHEINEHAKLYFKGLLEEGAPGQLEDCISGSNQGDEVRVTIQSDAGEEILFTGKPREIQINMVQNLRYIEMECYTGTYDMDLGQASRSFQHKPMKYDDMFKFILKDYPGADFINTGARGKEIGMPVIQYRETDWEFFKRMAASEGTVLTADVTSSSGKLWLGIPEPMKTVAVTDEVPTRKEAAETDKKKACFYYEIELADYLKVGDAVSLDGFSLRVTKSFISYEKGVIRNTYRLEKPPEMKAYSNEKIKGVSLGGSVLDVSLNHLKIHLDIDPAQKTEEAFWYPCVAEANNVWYTMPHKNERINLHITNSDENGLCMTNTRGDSGLHGAGGGAKGEMATTKSMSKPTEKYMETKWDKRLTLHEGDIEFDIPTVNVKMDEDSVYVTANDKITVESGTDINIGKSVFTYHEKSGSTTVLTKETKDIIVEADELVTIKVTNTESIIELDEDNKLHARKYVKMYGSNKSPAPVVFSTWKARGE